MYRTVCCVAGGHRRVRLGIARGVGDAQVRGDVVPGEGDEQRPVKNASFARTHA